jgi:hypothetical protein
MPQRRAIRVQLVRAWSPSARYDVLAMSVIELMTRFAERGRRYLWTDAFAVCNYVALGELDLAVDLVDNVHHALGRYRADDVRHGWISGLSESDGDAHPTSGGLRIGKPLAEDDGQYFHYLTRWMDALAQLALATRDRRYLAWARELADIAAQAFVMADRMVWKLDVELARPLVASMGQHDPLDGYVTYLSLDAAARRLGDQPALGDAIAAFRSLIRERELATGDPLGIGGLLVAANELARLDADPALREALLHAADRSLRQYLGEPDLFLDAEHRLAFRELGLAIGIAAIGSPRYAPVRTAIIAFWRDPAHRAVARWREHEDINDVMLATALLAPAAHPLHASRAAEWFARCST